jgi:hypothetical protein
MWQNDELNTTLKLFTAYLIDEATPILTNRNASDPQIHSIIAWENKNGVPNTVSNNYQKCLQVFEQNNLIYESDWSIHGTPRKYNLNQSFYDYILSNDFPYRHELAELKIKN